MKRLICFFLGHHWERGEIGVKVRCFTITCERCSKTEVVL